MKSKHFAVIVGTRPNFIKAVSFLRELKKHKNYSYRLIHTGQHYDKNMSEVFFDEMNISPPDFILNENSLPQMICELKNIFTLNEFDYVVLFGDVDSTLAGAVAATNSYCKIIHIEAGLRSGDKRMPEEKNRIIVDHLSDILFTSEISGNNNLIDEGILSNVYLVGNIMIETLESFRKKIRESKILKALKLKRKKYVVVTIHRFENISNEKRLREIFHTIKEINRHIKVVFCLHPNTQNKIKEYNISQDNLFFIEPLGYFDFMKLIMDSKGIITDSGGIQEETTHLKVPCCTLRENTERPITIHIGTNRLFHPNQIDDILLHLSTRFSKVDVPFWDKNVSNRIMRCLTNDSVVL